MPIEEPCVWHIVTVSNSGKVSILKNLTYSIARQTMREIGMESNPWSDGVINQQVAAKEMEIIILRASKKAATTGQDQLVQTHDGTFLVRPSGGYAHAGSGGRFHGSSGVSSTGSGMAKVKCWGPDGERMEVWPKPDDYDARLATAMALLDAANQINEEIDEHR